MSESESKWVHAGISEVKEGRVRIPDKLFEEAGIVSPGLPIYWSYEAVVKILVLSNQLLEDDEYKTVDFTTMGDEDDNYRCTIPAAFFKDGERRGSPEIAPSVPENAQVSEGERRHFMYNSEMADGETRSCYVLTNQEFSDRFEDSDVWDGKLSQVPEFV